MSTDIKRDALCGREAVILCLNRLLVVVWHNLTLSLMMRVVLTGVTWHLL